MNVFDKWFRTCSLQALQVNNNRSRDDRSAAALALMGALHALDETGPGACTWVLGSEGSSWPIPCAWMKILWSGVDMRSKASHK